MNYTTKSNYELRIMCKERNIHGYGGKKEVDFAMPSGNINLE